MQKDYSEYQFTAYDKYSAVRSGREGVSFSFFRNLVRFDPEKRSFSILVDDRYEPHTIQELIEEDAEAERARSGKSLEGHTSPEEEAELRQDMAKKEEANRALIERMSRKYDFERESADWHREEFYRVRTDLPMEPLINVFSGATVDLSYGEGLLDFIYADFVTPLKEVLPFFLALDAFVEENQPDENREESVYKIYDRTQEIVDDYHAYYTTFTDVGEIAYASLYSAICPPLFENEAERGKRIQWYGNYLRTLQREYLTLIEFCFDEQFYPGALGGLHPAERYALYRNLKDLPGVSTRTESVRFSIHGRKGTALPYGLPPEEIGRRLSNTPECTPDHTALAEKLGVPVNTLLAHIQIPTFLSVQYRFSTVADILELEFTKMLEHNVRFRKCKRCGRYFIMKGNYDTNYCSRVAEGESRSCQELAAAENYKARIADNKAIPVYNRYYKRYAARVKARQIKEDDFKRWKYRAISLRDDCSAGKITLEEYIRWMEDSFPNRKPKP